MKAVNSARYRKQAISERKIPDGLVSPAPMLPPILKVKWKAERESEKKVKVDADNPTKAKDFTFILKIRQRSQTKVKDSNSGSGPRDLRTRSAAKILTADELLKYW